MLIDSRLLIRSGQETSGLSKMALSHSKESISEVFPARSLFSNETCFAESNSPEVRELSLFPVWIVAVGDFFGKLEQSERRQC
jgi:hypothetical protein